jgi:hypothetical protein
MAGRTRRANARKSALRSNTTLAGLEYSAEASMV